jgi:hypothetical protein
LLHSNKGIVGLREEVLKIDYFCIIVYKAQWMAERLVPLLATQVARVWFPVPDRPTFRVEKVALFYNPASGGTFSSTAIEIIKWFKKTAVAQGKVFLHLEAWEYRIQRTA